MGPFLRTPILFREVKIVVLFEKYGLVLGEKELDSLVMASAIVMMGLEDGRQDEPDNEELVFLAKDLIASYVFTQFGLDSKDAADNLASDFMVMTFERGHLK